jgi:hypothetical protein
MLDQWCHIPQKSSCVAIGSVLLVLGILLKPHFEYYVMLAFYVLLCIKMSTMDRAALTQRPVPIDLTRIKDNHQNALPFQIEIGIETDCVLVIDVCVKAMLVRQDPFLSTWRHRAVRKMETLVSNLYAERPGKAPADKHAVAASASPKQSSSSERKTNGGERFSSYQQPVNRQKEKEMTRRWTDSRSTIPGENMQDIEWAGETAGTACA